MNISYRNATKAFEDLYAFIMSQGIDTNVGTKAAYNVGFYLRNPQQRTISGANLIQYTLSANSIGICQVIGV